MKKFISLLVTVLLLVSCLSLTTYAAKYDYDYSTSLDLHSQVFFSDDFRTLYFGQNEYVVFNNEHLYTDVYYEIRAEIKLTAEQKEKVSKIELTASEEGALIDAEIKYKDGVSMQLNFIKAEYLDEYEELFTSNLAEYEVDFAFPEGNTVKVSRDNLMGETFTIYDPIYYDFFQVLGWSRDKKICVSVGMVIRYEDEFYYFDYREAGTNNYDFEIYEIDSLEAHKITDLDVVMALTEAEKSYFSEDFGFLFNDNFTKIVADVFLVIIFAVLPFAVLVLFLIFALRSKGGYKKMHFTVSAIALAELIIFLILSLIVT